MWLGTARQKVYIVVEIGELPVERWRVGQYAQVVFIENYYCPLKLFDSTKN